MADFSEYLSEIGPVTLVGDDKYGDFEEYECVLQDDLLYQAMDQLREYIPDDDTYMNAYIRRYEDGSTRIWLGINEDFSSRGIYVEEEMELDDEVLEVLDTIPLEDFR